MLYYTPPPEAAFEDLKKAAIKLWSGYDDTYKYATSKIDIIKDIKNVKDNFMYMFAMFDRLNQRKLSADLTHRRNEIRAAYQIRKRRQ